MMTEAILKSVVTVKYKRLVTTSGNLDLGPPKLAVGFRFYKIELGRFNQQAL